MSFSVVDFYSPEVSLSEHYSPRFMERPHSLSRSSGSADQNFADDEKVDVKSNRVEKLYEKAELVEGQDCLEANTDLQQEFELQKTASKTSAMDESLSEGLLESEVKLSEEEGNCSQKFRYLSRTVTGPSRNQSLPKSTCVSSVKLRCPPMSCSISNDSKKLRIRANSDKIVQRSEQNPTSKIPPRKRPIITNYVREGKVPTHTMPLNVAKNLVNTPYVNDRQKISSSKLGIKNSTANTRPINSKQPSKSQALPDSQRKAIEKYSSVSAPSTTRSALTPATPALGLCNSRQSSGVPKNKATAGQRPLPASRAGRLHDTRGKIGSEDVPTSSTARLRSSPSSSAGSKAVLSNAPATSTSPKKRSTASPAKSQLTSPSVSSSQKTQSDTSQSSKRKVPLTSLQSTAIGKTTDSRTSFAPLRKSPARKADLKKPGEASNSASHAGGKVIRKGFAEGVRDAWRDGKEQRSKECDAKGSAKLASRKTPDLSKNGGSEKPVKIVEKSIRDKKSPTVAVSASNASEQKRFGENKVATPERPLRLKRASKSNLKLNIGAATGADDTITGPKLQEKVTASFSQRTPKKGVSPPKILNKPSKENSKTIPQYEFGGRRKIVPDTGDKEAHRLLGRSTSVKSDQQSSHETQEATLHIEEELSTPRTGEEGNSLNGSKLPDAAKFTTKEAFNSEDVRFASESQDSSETSSNRMVCGSGDNKAAAGDSSDKERKERIQRYKEERRKQIAARYGAAEWSSEEDSPAVDGGEGGESYRAYRRRRRHRDQHSGTAASGGRGGQEGGQHAGSDSVNNNSNNGSSIGSSKHKDGDNSAPAPPAALLSSSAPGVEGAPDSGESGVLSGVSGSKGRARPEGTKDKTHKRMSHLNRGNTTEEVLLDPDREDDGVEEHPRRRRRRSQLQAGHQRQLAGAAAGQGGSSPSAGKGYSPSVSGSPTYPLNTPEVTSPTYPLKTPEVVRNVVSRFTPPPSPPPAVYSTQTVQAAPFVPPKRPLHGCTSSSPIRKVSVTSEEPALPSTVKCRPKSPITHSVITASGKKEMSTSTTTKLPSLVSPYSPSSSFKATKTTHGPSSAPATIDHRRKPLGGSDASPKNTLQKPSIPDVLRSRDAASNLAAPSVVSSSPSAFKRPAETEPEGMPPTVVRSTLRKAQEIGGTCFMASRRDKKTDDDKPDPFKDFSLKNVDRWSKIDSPLNVDSSAPTSSNKTFEEEDASTKLTKSSRLSKSIGDVDASLNSEALVDECKSYLGSAASHSRSPSAASPPRSFNKEGSKPKSQTLDFRKDYAYDYGGQKNGVGGSEGHGAESEPLVLQQKEVKRENRVNFSVDCRSDDDDDYDALDIDATNALPSGSPKLLAMDQERAVLAIAGELIHGRGLTERHRSLDSECGDHRTSAMSPEPQSILKRRHSRDDVPFDRPMTPEPQGILKRKSSSRGSSSRASSVDTLDGELIPILKKKPSFEDLDHFEPKPILKKKSLTDDEFDDRPKSILKSARSGEDLHSGGDSGVVSPTPILKRSGRCDSDGEELLRPILKRRETTDGVRLRVHLSDGEDGLPGARLRSDSAPEAGARRSQSPSESGGTSGASSFPHSVHSSPSHRSSFPSGGPSSPQAQQQKRPSILKKRWSVSPGEDPSSAAVEGELSVALRSRRSEDESRSLMCSTPIRPVSPSLLALRGHDASDDDRPRRVSDRVADMEASPHDRDDEDGSYRGVLSTAQSPGTRPKTRAASFSSHRDRVRAGSAQDARRSSWASSDRSPRDIKFVPSPIRRAVRSEASGACVQFASSPTRRNHMDTSSEEDLPRDGDVVEALNRDVVEACNRAVYGDVDSEGHPNLDTVASDAARFLLMTAGSAQSQPSGVAQKAAFFAQLEQESKTKTSPRKERTARYATQPVTVSEVSRAARMAAGDHAEHRRVSPSSPRYPFAADQSQEPLSPRSFGASTSPVLPSSPRGLGAPPSPSAVSASPSGFGPSSPRHYATGRELPRTSQRRASFERGAHSLHSVNGVSCEDSRADTADPPLDSLQNAQNPMSSSPSPPPLPTSSPPAMRSHHPHVRLLPPTPSPSALTHRQSAAAQFASTSCFGEPKALSSKTHRLHGVDSGFLHEEYPQNDANVPTSSLGAYRTFPLSRPWSSSSSTGSATWIRSSLSSRQNQCAKTDDLSSSYSSSAFRAASSPSVTSSSFLESSTTPSDIQSPSICASSFTSPASRRVPFSGSSKHVAQAGLVNSSNSAASSRGILSSTPKSSVAVSPDEVSGSSVTARVALWSRRVEEQQKASPAMLSPRRRRQLRHQTQPVTLQEVLSARRQGMEPWEGNGDSSPRPAAGDEAEETAAGVRGILKRDGSREQHDSPRSILKQSSIASASSQSSSSSYSQDSPALSPPSYVHPKDTPTKGILKQMENSRSPTSPQCTVSSPPVLTKGRQLRGVLKKESSLEDGRGIRSILKPQSDFVRHSSDSSSDDQGLAAKTTPTGTPSNLPTLHTDLNHSATPLAETEDLGAALRKIESLARGRRGSVPQKVTSSASSNQARISQASLRDGSTALSSENLQSVSSVSSPALAPESSSRAAGARDMDNDDLESLEKEIPARETDDGNREEKENEGEEDEEDASENESNDEGDSPADGDEVDGLSDSGVTLRSKSSNDIGSTATNRTTLATTELNAVQILSQSPLFRKKFGSEKKTSTKNKPSDLSSCSTSVNARLAALHKSGTEGWKQRSQKDKDLTSNVTTRQKSVGGSKERPVSLMDRVSKLESSAQTWKVRVTESDASKYTVAHKLAMSASASSVPGMGLSSKGMVPVIPGLVLTSPKNQSQLSAVPSSSPAVQNSASSTNIPGSSPPSSDNSSGFLTPSPGSSPPNARNISDSPSSQRKVRKTPQPKIFKSKTGVNIPMMMPPQGLPGLKPLKVDYRRAISTPAAQPEDNLNETAQTVELFEVADEEFHKFFASASTQAKAQDDDAVVLNLADLDVVTSNVQTLGVERRRVQKHSRHRASAPNPMRALATKGLSQYTELRLHAGERELKRTKIEGFSKNSTLAVEALAGLASKENFSAVTLKPVTVQDTRELPPYTHPMLLRVKGRRHAEARLVQPSPELVNSGDDFILVTPAQVYHYKSEFANVIERAKAAEIASFIVQQKDLGVCAYSPVVEITENVKGIRRTRFWETLGGGSESVSAPPDAGGDDEEVEACLARSNKIYRVEGCALVPHEQAWGKPPTVDLLKSDQVLVFDFGSEVYFWSGKRAAPEERRAALGLAKELWGEPYDYEDCDINPVMPVPHNTIMKGQRPSWGILGKITENLETVLFKERFIDWPDTAQQTRIKEVNEELNRRPDPVCCLQPCSGEELLKNTPEEPDLVLEMSHLGRGSEYYDAEERRLHVISTKEFKVWHISEAGKTLLESSSRCHFHAADTYVVRWYYQVTATGRTLKGAPSKHAVTGRERVAYFFWQGSESSISDKGASALMTVELDEERGPHHRITMGAEPPAFLNLFSGSFVIHRGSRTTQDGVNPGAWRMFLVRGELKEEAHLLNVPVDRTLLRSRGCTLLINLKTCLIYLWHGCVTKAHPRTREIASVAAKHLAQSSAEDVGWLSSTIPTIKEQMEGSESNEFWRGMEEGELVDPQPASVTTMYEEAFDQHRAEMRSLSKDFKHLSLMNDAINSFNWTPRIWRLEAKHDSFEANEITSAHRLPDEVNPLPFCQDDLYSSHIQPALFLVDAGERVWLWQGWWPAEDDDVDEIKNANNCTDDVTNGGNDELDSRNNNNNINNINGYNDSIAAKTGSAVLRFNFARKAALQTALNFADTLGSRCKVEPSLVIAGLEPLSFINLFALWQCKPQVAAIQRKSGRYTSVKEYSAKEVLASLSRLHYSPEELRQQPAPDGVDPSRLEDYLADEDFLKVIGKTKKEFAGLPMWKKLDIKKKVNLF